MGDFNAKLGGKREADEEKIEYFGTEDMFKKQRLLIRKGENGSIECVETNKTLKKSIREDTRKQTENMIEQAIENGKNMKSIRTSLGKVNINAIKDEHGTEITNREKILRTTENVYKESLNKAVINEGSEDIPDISDEEIDLNTVEHVWDELGRHVKNRSPFPHTVEELRTVLGEE
ncbi:hypothetical protein ILUMI_23744 [Ignelater luminosus]|uniref:Uncharacterized protein n=1 Tax=Ignelater luminosus TaxID=2038154 RepID=A0A8K0C7I0_IGNLU|nr:hypothetical protein ILUMI_23744 [Ignelater luminosus]